MQTASWHSHGTHAGRSYTPGVGSDCPAALPSLAWLRGGTAGSGSSPWPTAPTSRGGRFRRSDSTFSPVARCRALPSVHAPQSPVPCVHLRRSEEHTSELQSHVNLVCRLLLEKKKKKNNLNTSKKKKKKQKKNKKKNKK